MRKFHPDKINNMFKFNKGAKSVELQLIKDAYEKVKK